MKKLMTTMCGLALGCGMLLSVQARAEVTQQDKDFLQKASQANFDEIKLSELAEQKATNPEVKRFAELMVKQHSELGRKVKPFAEKWGIPPVTTLDPEHQADYDKLEGLSGADFDREYVNILDQDHHQAVDLFTQEAQDTTAQKFKPVVLQGKSMVVAHMHMNDSLKAKLG